MSDKYYVVFRENKKVDVGEVDNIFELNIFLEALKKLNQDVVAVIHGKRIGYLYGEKVGSYQYE